MLYPSLDSPHYSTPVVWSGSAVLFLLIVSVQVWVSFNNKIQYFSSGQAGNWRKTGCKIDFESDSYFGSMIRLTILTNPAKPESKETIVVGFAG
jgi:hypothetical protein